MLKELQDFGLAEKEAKVYLAALELGPATADQLAKQSKVNRSTTYVQLEALMKVGLMTTYEEGKKTFFAAESPEALKRLLEEQKEAAIAKERELSRSFPELVRLFESAGERPRVRFFDGKDGINAMRLEALNAKKKEFLVLYNHDALADLYEPKERDSYSARRAEKGIRLRSIYISKQSQKGSSKRPDSQFRYLPTGKLPLTADFLIYDDNVAISSLAKKPFAVVIESSEIAQSFRSIFEFLWAVADTVES